MHRVSWFKFTKFILNKCLKFCCLPFTFNQMEVNLFRNLKVKHPLLVRELKLKNFYATHFIRNSQCWTRGDFSPRKECSHLLLRYFLLLLKAKTNPTLLISLVRFTEFLHFDASHPDCRVISKVSDRHTIIYKLTVSHATV